MSISITKNHTEIYISIVNNFDYGKKDTYSTATSGKNSMVTETWNIFTWNGSGWSLKSTCYRRKNSISIIKSIIYNVDDAISIVDDTISLIDGTVSTVDNSISLVDDSIYTVDDSIYTVDDTISLIDDSISIIDDSISIIESLISTVDNTISLIDDSISVADSIISLPGNVLSSWNGCIYAMEIQEWENSYHAVCIHENKNKQRPNKHGIPVRVGEAK